MRNRRCLELGLRPLSVLVLLWSGCGDSTDGPGQDVDLRKGATETVNGNQSQGRAFAATLFEAAASVAFETPVP